jgi:hypothetical protein
MKWDKKQKNNRQIGYACTAFCDNEHTEFKGVVVFQQHLHSCGCEVFTDMRKMEAAE